MKRLRSAAAVLFLPLHQRTVISQLGCVTTETKFKGETPGSTIYCELDTKPLILMCWGDDGVTLAVVVCCASYVVNVLLLTFCSL